METGGMRKPDLVCIGVQKAGTTWLHDVLGARPDVWIPPFKELHFFDHKFVPSNRRWTTQHVHRGISRARSTHIRNAKKASPEYLDYLDRLGEAPILNGRWYQTVFSRAGKDQLCLDVTPEYCTIPPEGVEFVNGFLKWAKFILIVRSPVERALSQIRMNVSRASNKPQTFEDWKKLALSPEISVRGRYSYFVPLWERTFSPDRLLCLPFGQISSDPEGLLRTIERFCGLPDGHYPGAGKVVHKTHQITVPEEIEAIIKERLRTEERFVERHFGKDFYNVT